MHHLARCKRSGSASSPGPVLVLYGRELPPLARMALSIMVRSISVSFFGDPTVFIAWPTSGKWQGRDKTRMARFIPQAGAKTQLPVAVLFQEVPGPCGLVPDKHVADHVQRTTVN